MYGPGKANDLPSVQARRDSSTFGEPGRIAAAIATAFGAPTGLIDQASGRWLARQGGPGHEFPEPAEVLRKLTEGTQAGATARVEVWRPYDGSPVNWLLLAVTLPLGSVLSISGFRTTEGPRGDGEAAWGPFCPEPALIAWGREVAERLRATGSRVAARASSITGTVIEGGEGVILARLIRRMKLSDAPERFQHLACNALRTTLGVQAVAWAPAADAEPVVVSGEVGTLRPEDYRAILPNGQSAEAVHLLNERGPFEGAGVRRAMIASADAQRPPGWLIAVNPLDDRPFRYADAELMQPVASVISTQQNNARGYADLKELLFGVIRSLTSAIDAKDPYTSGHSERVARIAIRLAEELGVPAAQRSDLYLTGLLHDVGKIGVDDAVLKKAGPLTPDEYRQIQRHVDIGVQILAELKKLGHLMPGVRHHHESLDGTGYPDGLAGDAIPFEARILAVADSYDAMSSTRPYRRRLTPSQIDEIFRKGSGSQWDPRVVNALFACRLDLEAIRQKGLGESLQVAVSGALGRT